MPFRASFSCLWCGAAHAVRSADDVEGWAQLCPSCVGRAGENGFLRFRLGQALAERAAATRLAATRLAATQPAVATEPAADRSPTDESPDELDDRYMRRGRFQRGPIHDAAWTAELDAAGQWLDALPIRGEIVELAAGNGWWSTLLASKGELSVYDARPDMLDRARERLVAHRLRAHLHVRDSWAEPDRQVDALVVGLDLGGLETDRLGELARLARRWLKPGGTFASIGARRDPFAAADDEPPAAAQEPDAIRRALQEGEFAGALVLRTGRFFLLATADG